MPQTSDEPGGAGEFGVAAAMAAVACAYARATGKMPTSFPINHAGPRGLRGVPDGPADPGVAARRPQEGRPQAAAQEAAQEARRQEDDA